MSKDISSETSSGKCLETFQCELCDFKSNNEVEIKTHMDLAHGRNQCSKCNKRFWDEEGLKDHINKDHIAISIKCDYTSDTVAGLGVHKQQ